MKTPRIASGDLLFRDDIGEILWDDHLCTDSGQVNFEEVLHNRVFRQLIHFTEITDRKQDFLDSPIVQINEQSPKRLYRRRVRWDGKSGCFSEAFDGQCTDHPVVIQVLCYQMMLPNSRIADYDFVDYSNFHNFSSKRGDFCCLLNH